MEDIWLILPRLMGVFLVIVAGAFCRRVGWLTTDADRSLANLCTNVLLPAYIADRIIEGPRLESLMVAWAPASLGFGATVVGFLIGWVVAKGLGRSIGLESDSKQRAFALCVGVCNYGYIPFPLAEIFYEDALVDLILHNVGVNLALWSVGIAIISGGGEGGLKKALLNPPFCAVIVATLLAQARLDQWVPAPILTAVGTLGDCAIPMGLILSGAIIIDFLSEAKWSSSLRVIATAIGIRQLVMPVLMLLAAGVVAGLAARSVELRQTMMLEAAMPAAIFPIVLVRQYQRDTQTALKVVLSTSLAGVVLIPVWLAIGAWWLSV